MKKLSIWATIVILAFAGAIYAADLPPPGQDPSRVLDKEVITIDVGTVANVRDTIIYAVQRDIEPSPARTGSLVAALNAWEIVPSLRASKKLADGADRTIQRYSNESYVPRHITAAHERGLLTGDIRGFASNKFTTFYAATLPRAPTSMRA